MTKIDLNDMPFPLDGLSVFCRLCMSANEKLYQLFNSDEMETSAITLSMKVALCTATAIKKNDMLPQKICRKCFNYVNEWYSFRSRCKKVNAILRKNLEKKEGQNLYGAEDGNASRDQVSEDGASGENSNSGGRKRKFQCSFCPDSFYFAKDLKSHRSIIHNSARPNITKKASPDLEDVDFKLDGINVRARYEMKCCNKVFFSKLKFRKHYADKHPGEKPFMCETCGKKDFISEETLKRHKILHAGKFRCEICFKTFTCNAILVLHKRDKHENDRPFVCDVCGKRFVTELLMNYHKRFHTGEKKYVCEECGLAVVTSSSLAKHKRTHSKEKPHVCHVCGKGFIIKGRLVEHLRVHTGERPFACHICHKTFTMRDKLKRHVRIHSGEKLFSCEYCGNNYSTRYGLSVHLKSHVVNG